MKIDQREKLWLDNQSSEERGGEGRFRGERVESCSSVSCAAKCHVTLA